MALSVVLLGPVQAQSPRDVQEQLDAVLAYVDDQIDNSIYDIEAFAKMTGDRPDSIVASIQDLIAYRPYWGALKGGAGVLVDRTGNALDQSLLAAKVMEFHGYETRIGYAVLSAPDAEELLNLAGREIPVAPNTFDLSADVLAVLLNEGGLQPDQVRSAAAEAQIAVDGFQRQLEKKTDRFNEAVNALMGPVVSELNADDIDSDALAMASEYFWVEYKSDADTWVPLSVVALPNQEVFARADTYFPSDGVPDALTHFVTISATLRTTDDEAEPISLGTVSVPSTAEYFAPVTVINRPLSSEEPTDLATAIGITNVEPEKMRFEIAAGGAYVLQLDYDRFGALSAPAGPGLNANRGLLDLSDQLDLNLGPKSDDVEKPTVSGLELSYTVNNSRGFERAPNVVVFERVAIPHQYHAGARYKDSGFGSPWNANVSIIPYAVTEEYMAHRVLKSLLTDMRQMVALIVTGKPNGEVPFDPLGIHLSGAYSTALIARAINQKDDVPVTFYVDQMSVIIEEVAAFSRDGALSFTNSIDLMQVSGRQDPGSRSNNGLGWTVAETLRALPGEMQETTSAFAFLETASVNAGTSVTKIESIDDARRFGDGLVRDLIPELDNGFEVYLVSHLGDVGWFSRDPVSGMVIGRLTGGRGSAGSEDTILRAKIAETVLNVVDGFECVLSAYFSDDPKVIFVPELHICVGNFMANVASTFIPGAALGIAPVQLFVCLQFTSKDPVRCMLEFPLSRAATFGESFKGKSLTRLLVLTTTIKGMLVANDGIVIFQDQQRKK